jgi:hypothetical protein
LEALLSFCAWKPWQHHDIKDFAREYMSEDVPGVALQWLLFGHNRAVYSEDAPLALRFTRRANMLDRITKTMFYCRRVCGHLSAHFPVYTAVEGGGNTTRVAIGMAQTRTTMAFPVNFTRALGDDYFRYVSAPTP